MIKRSHGGDVWRYIDDRTKVVDFSANINPLGVPPLAKNILVENLDRLVHYPEPESESLRDALADFHGIDPANLLIGNGSIELIYLIVRALAPRRVLIAEPTFSEYEFATVSAGADVVFAKISERNDFKVDTAKLAKSIPRSGLVFLCNPNNPTGTLLPREDVLFLADECKKRDAVLAVDEAFMEFVEGENHSVLPEASANGNLIVLRSLTKFFAIAGLRIGYLVGGKKMIKKLAEHKFPWNVNSLAQIIAKAVLKDERYISEARVLIKKEKESLFNELNSIKGIRVYSSSANFFLCKLESAKIKSAKTLKDKLIGRGIVVRDCGDFIGLDKSFFRVAVRGTEENALLISSLKEVLK